MPRTTTIPKRDRLVASARRLAYERGFHRTSLADIAASSGVPLGNVYYYFRTKDALGEALVDAMIGTYAALRAEWERSDDPRRRLAAFVDHTVKNRDALAASGCPMGTLASELHKEGGTLAEHASRLFAELLAWIEAQLAQLGRRAETWGDAVHLLAALQGASVLAHAFGDPRIVDAEAARLKRWIRDR